MKGHCLRLRFLAAGFCILLSAMACTEDTPQARRRDSSLLNVEKPPDEKITFDLSLLDDNGLYGPPDGKRALSYEFCIPDTEGFRSEVNTIDPTVEIMSGSPGRAGCGSDQALCIGSTHQPDFRKVLERLATLPYVQRIDECFFE